MMDSENDNVFHLKKLSPRKKTRAYPEDYRESEPTDVQQLNAVDDVERRPRTQSEAKSEHKNPLGQWGNQIQFVLSLIAASVGLGNIWRFPYLCQQHGGGVFLIPYTLMLFLEGIPMFYLEVAAGQRRQKGPIGVWKEKSKYMAGIGIGNLVVSFIIGLYYNVIITWCMFYFGNSFQAELPWASCPVENGTVVRECELSDSTTYFWHREALNASPSIEDTGVLNWRMTLCLLASWVVCFLCLCRGIKSAGKVVYVVSIVPYVILTIFLVRGLMLPGATSGLLHILTPKWGKLADPQVWLDAATQIFFSFGVAFGYLVAFASYSRHDNDCRRDVLLVSFTNYATSIFASVVIFSVLGFKAHTNYENCLGRDRGVIVKAMGYYNNSNVNDTFLASVLKNDCNFTATNKTSICNIHGTSMELERCDLTEMLDQSAQGTGLAFIVFTQAMLEFPIPPFWSVIFFLMLLTLGIGSQIAIIEGVITTLCHVKAIKLPRAIITGIVCGVSFLICLLFVTQAGEYWVKVFDSYGGSFSLMIIAFFEAVALWIYGIDKFSKEIQAMGQKKPNWYWIATWRLAPFLMFAMFAGSIVSQIMNPDTYPAWRVNEGQSERVEYPVSARLVGSFLVIIVTIWVPIVALRHAIKKRCKASRRQDGGNAVPADHDSGHSSNEVDDLSNELPLDNDDNGQGETSSTIPVLETK